MTTAAQLIDQAVSELLAGTVEERNTVASGVTSSDTTIELTYQLGGLQANQVVEIESELLYVWQVDTSAQTITVERAFGGSTAASHAAGVTCRTNPRFPRHRLLTHLNQELSDLSAPSNGLFRMVSTSLSYDGTSRMVNLTSASDVIDLYDVRLRYLASDYPLLRDARLLRDMPTSDFASGYAVAFDTTVRAGTLHVLHKAAFVAFASEASTVASTGASSHMEDILVVGAQLRALAGREVKRGFTETQGDPRRAEEVPPGTVAGGSQALRLHRRDRITAEAARLARQYPLRVR